MSDIGSPTGDNAAEQKLAPGRHMMTLRMTSGLRKKISDSAKLSGRSLSQEIEFRLEKSFSNDVIVENRRIANLLRHISSCIGLAELQTGRLWNMDEKTYLVSINLILRALDFLRPKSEIIEQFFASRVYLDKLKSDHLQNPVLKGLYEAAVDNVVNDEKGKYYSTKRELMDLLLETKSAADLIFWDEAEKWKKMDEIYEDRN